MHRRITYGKKTEIQLTQTSIIKKFDFIKDQETMNNLQQKYAHFESGRRLFMFSLAVMVSMLLALSLPTGAVLAGPVAPGGVQLTQPDGTVILVVPFGDENYSGYEYQGYTILLDSNTGYWVYAESEQDGSLVPGKYRAGLDALPYGLDRNLRDEPALAAIAASALEEPSGAPWSGSSGSGKVLIILTDFTPSTSRGTTAAQWNAKFFDTTPGARSVKSWYEQASYGQFTMDPVAESYGTADDGVIEVTLPYANAYPWPDETERTSVRDTLLAADPYIDYAALDTNHNGSLDNTELHLVLIVRGYEESYGGTGGACEPNVWGHRWAMPTGTCANCAPVVDGVTVGASAYNGGYTREGEWHEFLGDGCDGAAPGHIATMGIMVHELGHDIDWPDTYDTDGSSEGVGGWDIMAGGSWGWASGDLYSGETPVLPSAFLKWYQGWLTPVQVTAPNASVTIPNSAENNTAYQLGINPNGIDWNFGSNSGTGEYFLVENRQQVGYDAGLRAISSNAKGCFIWHIDETRTSANTANADETRKLVDVEEADGPPQDLDTSVNSGDSGDPWPGATGETAFSAASDPNSNWYDGSTSGIFVSNISTAGTGCTVGFTSMGPMWNGSVSSDWNNASNWTTGRVPNQNDSVIIPSGVPNWPNVNAAASVYNLSILNGAHVDATADVSLEVYGNWTEQGSGYFNASAGTVVLRGSSAQTITSGAGSHFHHLQIGNGSTTQTVTAGSDLDVNGNLTIQPGAKLSAGSYTLRVAGNWTDNPFGFDPGTGTVILDGTTQSVQRASAEAAVYSNDLTSTTGWSTYDANGGGNWSYSTSTLAPNSPDHGLHARYFYNATVAADDWLFSPGFTLQAGVTYAIRFNHGAYSAINPEKIGVHIGNAQTVGAMTTQVFDNNNIINLTWQQGNGTFTPTSSGTYYVGFHAYSDANRRYPAIDDLVVTASEPNLTFYNLSVANGSTATFANNAAVLSNVTVDNGSTLALGTFNLTVEGAVANNGALAQTRTVNAASTSFLNLKNNAGATDKYWGAIIDPGSNNLGSTTVTIRGNQFCPSTSDGVKRCFDLVPTTPQAAAVTFYYTEAERNGAENPNMRVYHWTGAAWEQETGATTRGGSGNSQWVRAANIDSYSPFALKSDSTRTVTFDSNGGSGTMTAQAANLPTALTLNTFTRTGYTFAGWNTNAAGTGTNYANGATYDFSADITLYAKWTQDEYTLTVNSAHGTVTKSPDKPTYHYGEEVTLSVAASGSWTFAGWTPALTDNKVTITGNTTVTANYTFLNTAPVAVDDDASTNEGTLVTINVLANDTDVDSDTLSVVSAGTPAHGSVVVNADNTVKYTPVALYHGTDQFTYTISDGNGGTDTATVTVTIVTVNDPPTAGNDTYVTNEDTQLSVSAAGVLVNDSDPDGDAITAVLVNTAQHGSLALSANGSFTYTPAANYNGSDSFTYKANDGSLNSGEATVSITINAINDAPIADAASVSLDEDAPIGITLTGSDVDGDTLNFNIATPPAEGALSGSAPDLTYTPDANFNGADSFTFTVSDGFLSAQAQISITVDPINDAPLAAADTYETDQNVQLDIPAPGVLANDTDVDADTLTAILVDNVSHGTLTLNSDGSFAYAPAADFIGTDSFTYKANDSAADSNTVTVTLKVNTANRAPSASNDEYTTDEDTALTIVAPGVLDNDTDPDGDTLTAVKVTDPSHGALTFNADGSFTYTPASNWSGTDSFTYKATDGLLESGIAEVTLHVASINDAPVATAQSVTVDEDGSVAITLSGTDIDGDTLNYAIASNPASGTLSGTLPGMTYETNANFFGNDAFTFTVDDGQETSGAATVSIQVNPINDAPTCQSLSLTANEDVSATLSPSCADIDSAVLSYQIVDPAQHGTAAVNAGLLSYVSSANYSGPDSFTYKASDGSLASNTSSVTVTVSAVNDAPVVIQPANQTNVEGQTASLQLSASDPEGDTFTFAVSGLPQGLSVNPNTGLISGTLGYASAGVRSVTVTVTDSHGAAATRNFTWTVTDLKYTLTVKVVGSGTVGKSPNQVSYEPGTVVTLTATPVSGWTFSAWSGNLSGATNPAAITINGNKTVTATFVVKDVTAPNTKIVTYPPNPSKTSSATFTFSGTDNVTPPSSLTFQCKLDAGAWAACPSPKTYSGLANGAHKFSVRAKDAAGNLDATPAVYSWTVAANRPPVADAGGPYSGNEGTSISLSAAKSTDPDNNITLYQWDLDNDGQFDDATGKTPKFAAVNNGVYTVRVRVKDAGGLTSVDSATVTVKNVSPVIASLTLTDVSPLDLRVTARATFKDAGVKDTFTAVWKWGDGTTSAGTVTTTTATGAHVYAKAGVYTVTIIIKDKDGGTAQMTKSITVLPKK
jgi:M6 family metalloprotease-like protein/uncharacterized repeat protein (TIGR02543 family)